WSSKPAATDAGGRLRSCGTALRSRRSALPPLELDAQLVLLLAQLGREFLAEILGLVDRPDLEDALLARHRVRALARPLERLVHGLDLPEPEARDELLRLGERAVDDRRLAARER